MQIDSFGRLRITGERSLDADGSRWALVIAGRGGSEAARVRAGAGGKARRSVVVWRSERAHIGSIRYTTHEIICLITSSPKRMQFRFPRSETISKLTKFT